MGEDKKIYIADRTVAFLDVLGFRSILKKYELENIGKWYDNLVPFVDGVQNDERIFFNHNGKSCVKTVFSDSIIICSTDDTKSSFLEVINYVKRLIQTAVIGGVLIRGAVTFGSTYVNQSSGTFVGDPIVRAADLEKQQEWVGVMLDEVIENKFQGTLESVVKKNGPLGKYTGYDNPNLVKYSVPFKCGNGHRLYTVNWLDKFPVSSMGDAKKIMLEAMEKAPVDNRKKYENTIKYIEYIHSIFEYTDNGLTMKYLNNNDRYS